MTKEEILQKLQFDTKLRGLSKNTQDEYYTKAKQFQNHYDKPATELTVEDIKGGKDRFAILSKASLDILREYWRQYRPKDWLFYSCNQTGTHITPRAMQNMFRKYKDIAGITKKVTSHTLRHSLLPIYLRMGSVYFISSNSLDIRQKENVAQQPNGACNIIVLER